MRVLVLTHRFDDPSFRIRWGRFLEQLDGNALEIGDDRGAIFRAAREAETVVLHRRLLTAFDFMRLRMVARRLIYDFDDALCYRPQPPYRSLGRARRFFRTVHHADLVFAGNRVLAGLARLRAERVFVIPSTVDVESYAPTQKLAEPTAVWIGQRATLGHLEPIVDAVAAAGLKLRVIADAAPQGAELVPWSLEDEARRLAECHVGLMPLPDDPFARGKCGYKLLQCYAAGLPAVTSPVGVNRGLAAGGGALLARTPEEWRRQLERLAGDVALRESLATRGRSFVARRYASSKLIERLDRLI